jgi:hypothetical protein
VTQRFSPNINGNGNHNPLGNDTAMDSTLLQLFAPDEIFEKLAGKSASGLLHVYNWRDTANIFFKNGLIVAAAKGLIEGEDAVRQAIDIKEPHFVWHANVAPSMPPYRPIQVAVTELFDRHAARKASPELKNAALPVAPPPMPTEIPQPAPPPFLSAGRGSAGMTTALPRLESPMTAQATKSQWPTASAPASSGKVATAIAPAVQQPDLPTLKKAQYSFVAIDNPRQRIHLTKESTLVGRNPACDITLDHGSISRQHCLMQISDRGLHVKDLGTTNGTKINGVNITEGYINPGDQLTMGHLVFILEKD